MMISKLRNMRGIKSLGIASIATAFLASLCCIGPLLLAGLGIGGAALFAGVAAYRPYFLGVTIALLSTAGFMAWRKRTRKCEPGGSCAMPSSRRSFVIWIGVVAVLSAVLLAFPYLTPRVVPTSAVTMPNDATWLALEIQGMTCNSCASAVQQILTHQPGVYDAKVEYAGRTARIAYDEDLITPGQIVMKIHDAGYQAQPHTTETIDDER